MKTWMKTWMTCDEDLDEYNLDEDSLDEDNDGRHMWHGCVSDR